MSKDKCGYCWENKFWVEGNLESILAAHEAVMAAERARHLLAVIHGDGGHHTEAVGIMQSLADAERRVTELRTEIDSLLNAPEEERQAS